MGIFLRLKRYYKIMIRKDNLTKASKQMLTTNVKRLTA